MIGMLTISSCESIQQGIILDGKWEVMKVELDHGDLNAMEVFLQGYKSYSQCCHYFVDFRDDGTCSGTYYRNDSLVYTVEGEWDLKEFNLVYVNLDKYVNADLDVNRHSQTYYTLDSEENNIIALAQVHPTKLEIKRTN